MVQAQLLVAAALALLAVTHETSAAVAAPRAAPNSISVVELFDSDDSTSSRSHEEQSRPLPGQAESDAPWQALDDVRDEGQAEPPAVPEDVEAEAVVGNAADDEGLPPSPSVAEDEDDNQEQPKVTAEQSWESRFKHGLVPARLPARESDNGHGYRHSIIHPYGDDVHA